MILRIFALYDLKAQMYQVPYYCHNEGHALRVFMQVYSDPKTTQCQFPNDYQLFELGSYDDQNGELSPIKPRYISLLNDLLKEAERE